MRVTENVWKTFIAEKFELGKLEHNFNLIEEGNANECSGLG